MTDLNNTKKCIVPWIHINVEPTGDLFLCCRADQTAGNVGNLNDQSLEDIWKGEKYTAIRNQMISGVEPEACKICFNTERLGGLSKRMRENDLWKDHWHLTNTSTVDFFIPYIDIRFNNICNLKCRSCRPLHSHSIGSETIKLGKSIPHSIVLDYQSTEFDNDLTSLAPYIEEIYFCGGEPLLMDKHYQLIDKLIEVKNYKVRLRYSTNLTKLVYKNYNVLDKWKLFDNVSIHASLDGIENKLEYIRHGTDWENIIKNLDLLKKNNIDIKISPTVSVFNILDIDEICSYYIDNKYITENDLGLTVLETPYYYSVQTLHPELKMSAKNKIENFIKQYSLNVETTKRFNHLINYMYEKDTWLENKQAFKDITTELDLFRNENFLKTFPELSKHYD